MSDAIREAYVKWRESLGISVSGKTTVTPEFIWNSAWQAALQSGEPVAWRLRKDNVDYGLTVYDRDRVDPYIQDGWKLVGELYTTPQPATTKPIAAVKGWFHGECVVQALDPSLALPAGMALYAAPQPVVPEAEALARMFHETYESLAEVAGYETRLETRSFNLESPNGRLMVLVCAEIRKALLSAGKGGE